MPRPASPELQRQAWRALWDLILAPDPADPENSRTGGSDPELQPCSLPPVGEEGFGYGNQASPG